MTFAETLRGLMTAAPRQKIMGQIKVRDYLEQHAAQIVDVIEAADRCPHQSGELAEALRKLEGKS